MTTAATSLLGLALPVTGELAGTWGTTVNDSITSLLDTAVAGTTTLSTDGDVTLSTTTLAANQARQAILLCSGARTALRTITAPAQSKIYTIINATTGGYSVKLVGAGPTTGVTIVAGESALVAWNGSDFIKISNTGGAASFTNVTVSGTTTLSGLTASTALALNASKEVVSVTNTGTGNNVLSASPTLTGTIGAAALTLSSDLTLSGGTANGVLYLNGSKVATSGSALTFDGTNLGLSGTGSRFINLGSTSTNGQSVALQISAPNSDASASVYRIGSGLTADNEWVVYDVTNTQTVDKYIRGASGFRALFINGSEVMRLTSTGLGIGTPAPATQLDVSSNTGTEIVTRRNGGRTVNTYADGVNAILAYSTGALRIGETTSTVGANFTERMRLDSSGNLGLGVTPSAWLSTNKAFQFGYGAVRAFSNSANTYLDNNNYVNTSGTDIYLNSGYAGRYRIADNQHIWYQAPSGNAGDAISFTQAMTLDASGNLVIGDTSASYRLDVKGSAGNGIAYRDGTVTNYLGTTASGLGLGYLGTLTNHPVAFLINATERARITSGGYFKASDTGTYVGSTGAYHEFYQSGTTNVTCYFGNNSTTPNGIQTTYLNAAPNGTGNEFLYCSDTASQRAAIRSNGGLANYSANNVNLSDRREKTNFAPAKSYLETICAIPVQTFNYIDQNLEEDAGLTLGVVAQDVQAVAPELVMESNWGTKEEPKMRLSIYQTDLQYALMKCIQEQQALIQQLTARVAQLESN